MRNSDPNLDLNDQKEEPEVKPNKVVSPIQIEGFCYYFWRNILFFVINLLGENQNSWIYRCKYRNLKKCDGRISIPKKFNFKALESEEERKNEVVKIKFQGNKHICRVQENEEEKTTIEVQTDQVSTFQEKGDDDKLISYIKENVLKGPLAIKDWCKAEKLKASKHKIKNLITEIREEFFPSNKDMALSNQFCSTRGDFGGGINFCRFRGTVNDEKNNTTEVLIFSSPCLLRLLKNQQWFVDGTFKIVPSSHRQLLIIIVYHALLDCYLPACYLLMSHKTKIAYRYAFSNLILLCKTLEINLAPQYIMCDFESALRKGIQDSFPKSQITGCYFHYCKALWSFMARNSLTTKERLLDSIRLMVFLKIMAHVEISQRKDWFEEISELFKKKDKKYKDMLNYYKNNWLNSYYVESLSIGEDEGSSLIIRTNNVCETYNHYFKKKLV